MESLVQTNQYVAINAADTTTPGYYVVQCVSNDFTLQEDITTDGWVTTSGELVVRSEYLSNMKAKTNWYWKHNGNKKITILSNRTIVHSCLDV